MSRIGVDRIMKNHLIIITIYSLSFALQLIRFELIMLGTIQISKAQILVALLYTALSFCVFIWYVYVVLVRNEEELNAYKKFQQEVMKVINKNNE